jgi:hypothetical protein
MDDTDPHMTEHNPFEARRGRRRFGLRDTVVVVLIVCVVGVLLGGDSLHRTAESLDDGIERDIAVAVTSPLGWIASQLPFEDATDDVTASLAPDDELDGASAFTRVSQGDGGSDGSSVAPVTRDAFDPAALGTRVERTPLKRLLITGDSLAMPLDTRLARRLSGDGVHVDREPHAGTGISKTALLDWGRLSAKHAEEGGYDAVVLFIGANEGFPFPAPDGADVRCCGADWAAAYATRVRLMMDAYRRRGDARVYWLTLPTPRDRDRAMIARTVNASIRVAASAYGAHVRVVDMVPVFTPGDRYRAAMPIGGSDTIVRESDGIHLNEKGADLAADQVLRALGRDFTR